MGNPVSVLDVAAYILMEHGRLSTWKLQKLCYYAPGVVTCMGRGTPVHRAHRGLGKRPRRTGSVQAAPRTFPGFDDESRGCRQAR